jgi:hypothetical protein
MSDKESRYRKIAAECYERVMQEVGGRFDVEDVRDVLVEEILSQGVTDDIVDDFVDGLLAAEDKKRTRAGDSRQLDLFSGEDAAFDAVWALGGGERVQARHATKPDVYARLGLRATNLSLAADAFAREQEKMARLLPYMIDETVTVPTAFEAWRRDNDGAA